MSLALADKLKKCDAAIQKYVARLEAENEKLQDQIADLEVKNLSANNRITALKKGRADPDEKIDEAAVLQSAVTLLELKGYTVKKGNK